MALFATKRRLIAIACIVFLVGVVAKIPAGVALQFAPELLQTRGVSGTLWSGSIDAVAVDGQVAGPLTWQLKPLALLGGALAADVECSLGDGFFSGGVKLRGDTVTLTDAKLAAALGDLTRRASIGPSQGVVNATVPLLEMTAQWPTRVDAQITIKDLQYSGSGPEILGSYRLTFAPDNTSDEWPVVGTIQSIDGPFNANGTMSLGDNRSYAIEATVSSTADASNNLKRSLAVLGPASRDGSHTLTLNGSL
ncbi:MAG: type II secretion system protein N [Pseudomonadota bacterium]